MIRKSSKCIKCILSALACTTTTCRVTLAVLQTIHLLTCVFEHMQTIDMYKSGGDWRQPWLLTGSTCQQKLPEKQLATWDNKMQIKLYEK